MSRINFGDVPNWLLVAITFIAVVSAGRILKIERNRDLAATEERKRAQATFVSAWAVIRNRTPAEELASNYYVAALVQNSSNQPIHEVSIFLFMEGKPVGLEDGARLIPPNSKEELEIEKFELSQQYKFESLTFDLTLDDATMAASEILIEVQFTDSSGRRWTRGVDGQLHLTREGEDSYWSRGQDGLLHLYQNGRDIKRIDP